MSTEPSSLAFSKSVKALNFALCNKISDYSPIGRMEQLEAFRTDSKIVQSLDFLKNLKQLRELTLAGQKILNPDVSPILDLPNLEELFFRRKLFSKKDIAELKNHHSNCRITIW